MKRIFLMLALLLCLLLISCNTSMPETSDSNTDTGASNIAKSGTEALQPRANENNEGTEPGESTEPSENDTQNEDSEVSENMNEFILKATVSGMSGTHLEIEVIESNYAFGTYWVIVPDTTPILNAQGQELSLADLRSGDTVQITYNGQTMMSYPPQIVALSITVK